APAATSYLYFVAKNDGSHAFSSSIDEHNRNVNLYQRRRGTAPPAASR
ncbi:MAG: endolytic transglycosylase MltG, partial [Thermoanaerobaculia bacterium]